MATRKAITLVSGLFQEVNTPTDKLDFAGNTTADLSENTNLYFTNARSRSAVSVTDAGGLGSLAYNSSTGVITYTGASNSDVRGLVSVASGSGLTYNSGTGEFGTSAIPNGQLANSSVTIGSTSVSLGATVTNFAGLGQLVMSDAHIGSNGIGGASTINIQSGQIIFEGSTADANETILSAADATGGDKSLILPNESGTLLSTGSSIANSNLANSAVTIGSTSVSLGATASTIAGLTSLASGTLIAGVEDAANAIEIGSGNITFEGSTADGNEIILTAADASGSDKTITLPNATGTVALLSTLSIASGSGLTYNSGTGEFSTNAIPNSKLANSSVTVGSTAIALGNSSTTLAGLSSVTSTAVVTNDSGFRIRNNSDNTKIGAFSSASITGGQTRTLTFPDADGTIATQAYVNSQISAEDLDVETDSGNFDVDLNSEALTIAGGTGIDSSGSGTTATIAIDSTVATLTGSQTLTNKTLAAPTVTGTIIAPDVQLAGTIFHDGDTDTKFEFGTNQILLKTGNATRLELNNSAIMVRSGFALGFAASSGNSPNIKSGNTNNQELLFTIDNTERLAVEATGIDVTGNITVSGTVDGVDVATRDTLFAGLTSSSGVLSNGVTATTQSASDNSTKVATTAYVDNAVSPEFADNVFRVKDNSDASKKLAFECSGISGSTTRTMTVPDANGTISTESFATAIAVALG